MSTTTGPVRSAGVDDAQQGAAEADLVPLLTDYLDEVAYRTATRLGDIAGVAVTFDLDGVPFTIGASNALARAVDLVQYQVGKGPCLHALRHGVGLYVPDLADDGRWDDYGPKAAALGAASCVSVPVFVNDQPCAVLKVYGKTIDGVDEGQRVIAQDTAPEVAGGVGLARHLSRQAHQLDGQTQVLNDRITAMATRRVIDLAVGILMRQLNTDPDTAFDLLRSMSQSRNIKVRDVAHQLVASLPTTGTETASAPFNERGRPPVRAR